MKTRLLVIIMIIFYFLISLIFVVDATAQCIAGPTCGAGTINVHIEINTDFYGEETSWVINDLSNSTSCGIAPYAAGCSGGLSTYMALNTYTYDLCYPEGSAMEFTIGDDFGDGGADYTISICNQVIASGSGNWGCSKTHTFTMPIGGCSIVRGTTCSNSFTLSTLEFDSLNMTTQNFGNDYNDWDACGSSYMNGDDFVFDFTPTKDTCLTISLNNCSSYTGLFLFDGCPDNLFTTCIAQSTGPNPEISMINVTRNSKYYLVISTSPAPQFTAFDISLHQECMPTKPTCSVNDTAHDYCNAATFISNLNGYCGNTSDTYTVDAPGDLTSNFCGSIENNSWLSFIADSTIAKFFVFVDNCTNSWGIQITIYESDCNTFVPKSNCWNPGYQTDGIITARNLTPGNMYYIMIDGYSGDVCDYVIGAKEGSIAVLPIRIDHFTAENNFQQNKISWKTSYEKEISFMEVLKSEDGIHFLPIGSVVANNNGHSSRNYSIIDNELSSTINYYRLRMIDKGGRSSLSKTILVRSKSELSVSTYPNPVNTLLNMDLTNTSESIQKIKISVHRPTGVIFYTGSMDLNPGVQSMSIPFDQAESGVYFIKVIVNNSIVVRRIIVEN